MADSRRSSGKRESLKSAGSSEKKPIEIPAGTSPVPTPKDSQTPVPTLSNATSDQDISEKEKTSKKKAKAMKPATEEPPPKSAGAESAASGKKSTTGKKGKKGKAAVDVEVPVAGIVENLPDGVVPIFLASKTQELFGLRSDEDVTLEEPQKFLKKEEILKDLQNRAAVCDFHPIRQLMIDYPEDEILIVYDPEFKYGQNFYIATTEEAKQLLLKHLGLVDSEELLGNEEEEEEDDVIQQYVPPVAKDWLSFGSEKEIEDEAVVEHRKSIMISVKRVRREFGAMVDFVDRNAVENKDCYVECLPYEDKAYDLKKMELDIGSQAVPVVKDIAVQTTWKYPKNAAIQCEPRTFTDDEAAKILDLPELAEFLRLAAPRVELALQQNEIMDVFDDDWGTLADEDDSFGSKADNHLKEFQSFTDLQFSKNRTITCIDWHPTIKGVVAVSVAERMSFDERVDNSHKIIMFPSLILVWSFTDPIHPQLLLEAPDDIICFKFSPTDPNFVAGGCINGQVVLWDIAQYADRLRQSRGSKNKDPHGGLSGFEDEKSMTTPIMRYCAMSSVEHSHQMPITDIMWLPDHLEINRMGVPQENKSGQCVQLMTCSTDHPSLRPESYMVKMRQEALQRKRRSMAAGMHSTRQGGGGGGGRGPDLFGRLAKGDLDEEDYLTDDEQLDVLPGTVLFWEIRHPQKPNGLIESKKEGKNISGIPATFKHVDLTWKPHLKVTLFKSEPGGDHAPTKFSISEVQGDKSVLAIEDEEVVGLGGAQTPKLSSTPGGGPVVKRLLKGVNTHFYVGTEDGEVVYVDWMPQKDQESGKIQTPKPIFYHALHSGPIVTMQRSPFFKDVVLCVGGWSFSLWKEGVDSAPILNSCSSSKRLTAGHWSPSRAGVFFVTKQDGSIDIWDLLDRTHEPCMNQSVSSVPLTCISPFQVTSKQHLLAVGDANGTLHILAIPWSLRQPTQGEKSNMELYIEREVKRREFVLQRWDLREKEKADNEAAAKRKAGIAPQIAMSDEEMENRMKLEYQAYLEQELIFLRKLGLRDDSGAPVAAAS